MSEYPEEKEIPCYSGAMNGYEYDPVAKAWFMEEGTEPAVVYRDRDIIPILGKPYKLNFSEAHEVLEGTDDPGACIQGETIYVRLDVGDPKETLAHEIQEAVRAELVEAAKEAMGGLIHE